MTTARALVLVLTMLLTISFAMSAETFAFEQFDSDDGPTPIPLEGQALITISYDDDWIGSISEGGIGMSSVDGSPEDKTPQLNAFMECIEKDYSKTEYGTEDLVNNGDGIPSKVNPDMMLNEKGLRSERSNHPELYEGDCYKYADIIPQEIEAGYRESIGK